MPYLFLDATYVDLRWARSVENASALVAYGVGRGHRHQLAVTIVSGESEESWGELLSQVLDRACRACDSWSATTIGASRRRSLDSSPKVKHQRCTVHLTRNVMLRAPHVYVVGSRGASLASSTRAHSLRPRRGSPHSVPDWDASSGAFGVLEGGFDAARRTSPSHSPIGRAFGSTNGVERLHGEIRENTRCRSVPGSAERSTPHHRRRSRSNGRLERASLPRHDAPSASGKGGANGRLIHGARPTPLPPNQPPLPLADPHNFWDVTRFATSRAFRNIAIGLSSNGLSFQFSSWTRHFPDRPCLNDEVHPQFRILAVAWTFRDSR